MVFKLRDLLACVVVSKTTCYSSNCSWSTEKSRQSQKRLFSEAHFLYLNQLQQSQGENNPIQLINKHNLNTFTMISHQLFFTNLEWTEASRTKLAMLSPFPDFCRRNFLPRYFPKLVRSHRLQGC